MKKLFIAILALAAFTSDSFAQQYLVVTSVESIVPMGIGRSRIITHTEEQDASALTTERTEENNKQNRKSRKDVKIDNFEETKLLNFYSAVGINFKNIASNDAVISSKLNELSAEGWELMHVVSGVESNAGKDDGQGIFITRYIFKR